MATFSLDRRDGFTALGRRSKARHARRRNSTHRAGGARLPLRFEQLEARNLLAGPPTIVPAWPLGAETLTAGASLGETEPSTILWHGE